MTQPPLGPATAGWFTEASIRTVKIEAGTNRRVMGLDMGCEWGCELEGESARESIVDEKKVGEGVGANALSVASTELSGEGQSITQR